jgi:hypothetical protein
MRESIFLRHCKRRAAIHKQQNDLPQKARNNSQYVIPATKRQAYEVSAYRPFCAIPVKTGIHSFFVATSN